MVLGPWQVVLVFIIVLVLFGAGKLPQVMTDLGKGMRNLKNELSKGADIPSVTPDDTKH